jgi:hypothetical protein
MGLTLRQVEARSVELARRLKTTAYLVPLARLSEYERGKGVPPAFKMYSLAVIFRCPLAEVLSWYRIPPA